MAGGSGNVITPGTPVVVDAGRAGFFPCVEVISSSQAIIFYVSQAGGTSTFKANVVSIAGTTCTVNAATTVESSVGSAPGNYTSIAKLSSTKFVVGYNTAKAMILDVSGTTITANSAISITNATDYVAVGNLTSTGVLAVYKGTGPNYIAGRVLTASGSTLTENSETVIDTANSGSQPSIGAAISTTQYVSQYSNSSLKKAVILDVVGTTITANTAVTITNAGLNAYDSAIDVNNSTKFTTVYYKAPGAATRLGAISGTSITFGSETVLDASGINPVAYTALTTDAGVGLYGNSTGSGESVVINSTTPISTGAVVQYDAGAISYTSIKRLSDNLALAFYVDQGNSSQLTVCALGIS